MVDKPFGKVPSRCPPPLWLRTLPDSEAEVVFIFTSNTWITTLTHHLLNTDYSRNSPPPEVIQTEVWWCWILRFKWKCLYLSLNSTLSLSLQLKAELLPNFLLNIRFFTKLLLLKPTFPKNCLWACTTSNMWDVISFRSLIQRIFIASNDLWP